MTLTKSNAGPGYISSPTAPNTNYDNPLISADKLKQLYSAMLRLRKASDIHRSRRMVSVQLEACEVACTIDARADTIVLANEQLTDAISEATCSSHHRNAEESLTEANSSSPTFLKIDSRDRVTLATGVALGCRAREQKNVIIVFCTPDELEHASESLRVAQRNSLPIVYVQIGRPGRNRSANGRSRSGKKIITSVPVDQSDVVAIYRVAHEAIEKARRRAGPTAIECMPFPHRAITPRNKDHHLSDPVAYMEHYLRKRNLWSDELKQSP